MRTLLTAIPAALILALSGPVATTAVAAEGALPAGKPMGVHQAQMISTPLIVVGAVAVAAVAIGVSSSSSAPATALSVSTSP